MRKFSFRLTSISGHPERERESARAMSFFATYEVTNIQHPPLLPAFVYVTFLLSLPSHEITLLVLVEKFSILRPKFFPAAFCATV